MGMYDAPGDMDYYWDAEDRWEPADDELPPPQHALAPEGYRTCRQCLVIFCPPRPEGEFCSASCERQWHMEYAEWAEIHYREVATGAVGEVA